MEYCEQVAQVVEEIPQLCIRDNISNRLNYLREGLSDTESALAEVSDAEARTGHKSKDDSFFGCKTHISMAKNRIITKINKDADLFVCPAGHLTQRKARIGKKNKNTNQTMTYYFDIEKCKDCPLREGCYKEGAKSKTYSVSIKSDQHQMQKTFEETKYF